ncbi:cytochrome P450 [Micromonospora sp. DT4]|uniref:cytochrome P450 n=1 Tax=Micromonospora sp. DT4 TaxID=3393438 RepID=UPI003CF99881
MTAPVRFNPFSPDFRNDPYPIYRRLREDRPVLRTRGLWVLTRHADVRATLTDRSFSVGLIPQLVSRNAVRHGHGDVAQIERLGQKSLVFTDNPEHARLKGIVNRIFGRPAIAELRPRIAARADELIEAAAGRGRPDLIAGFAEPLPLAVMCDWMALPDSIRARVGGWTHEVRHLLEPNLMTGDDLARVRDVVRVFAAALDEVVAERRRRPGDDLISRMLAARTAGGDALSAEELVFLAMMCFVAGNETTTALIGNTLHALARHPDQDARLRDQPELTPAAVGEALRYDSPLHQTMRLATRDVEIGGQPMRAGEQVLLCLGAANRDPAVFLDPDAFDLSRDTGPQVGFGHGMHACLGAVLARLQAEIAVERLYRRAPGLRVDVDDLERRDDSSLLRGLRKLPAVLGRVG